MGFETADRCGFIYNRSRVHAATQACKEAIWIQRLLKELGHGQEKIYVFCDSQSALHIARNPVFHSRTKHIGVQYHFIREVVEDESVDL